MRKPLVCVATMIVIAAITFWAVALSTVTREARKITFSQDLADQISVGMTRTEVEAILGCPPGDYTTGPSDSPPLGSWAFIRDYWASDTGIILVWFDDEGRVRKVIFGSMRREPFVNRWYRWLPWW